MEGGVDSKHIPYSPTSIAELLFQDTALYYLVWLYSVMVFAILLYLTIIHRSGGE